MSVQVQFRRGNTAQHSVFTGAPGEITVDTDKGVVVVHDGVTPGGNPLAPNIAFDVANAAFNSANNVAPQVAPSYDTANAAFNKANAANVLAYQTGIGANAYANLVGTAGNAYTTLVYNLANAAFDRANLSNDLLFIESAYSTANAAYDKANNALANTSGTVFDGNLIVSANVKIGSNLFFSANGHIYNRPNSSGDGYGYDTLEIYPDNRYAQGLIIDPTVPSHIHIRGTGDQDNSITDLFIGGENSHFRIPAGLNPVPVITSNGSYWTFYNDGGLSLPDSTIQYTAYTNTVFDTSNAAFNKANAANVLAYNTGIGANAYADVVGETANNYAGQMANSVNAWANTVGTSGNAYAVVIGASGNDYTNVSTTAANNYSGVMANSSNGYAVSVGASGNAYANLVGTSGNAYTVVVGASGNSYANLIGSSSNSWSNTVGVSGNAYANLIGTSGNSYTDLSTTSSNNYAGFMSNSANAYAASTYLPYVGGAITGDISITGNLNVTGETTYVNTKTVQVGTNLLVLDAELSNTSIPYVVKSGLQVNRGILANTFLVWDEASTSWTFTNDGSTYLKIASNTDIESTLTISGTVFDKANAANVLAYNTGIGANAYSDISTNAANNYSGVMANSSNGYTRTFANTVGVNANTWANTVGTSGNAYAVVVGASGNAYTNLSTTSANNYAGYLSNTVYGYVNASMAIANAAYDKANNALANSSGVVFDGDLIITGSVTIGASELTNFTLITSSNNNQILDHFDTTLYRSAHYTITINSGVEWETTQVSLIHNSSDTFITEYGLLYTSNILATFSASVTLGEVRLNVVPKYASSTIRVLRTTLDD